MFILFSDNKKNFNHFFYNRFKFYPNNETAELFTGAALPDAVKETLTIVKIVPERISYFNSTGTQPVKYIWDTHESALK